MIRIGQPHAIHPEVKQYTLENLRDLNLRQRLQACSNVGSMELEIKQTQKRINDLGKDISEATSEAVVR